MTSMQPVHIQTNYSQNPIKYAPSIPTQEPQHPYDGSVVKKEQAMAISYDIAAEYAATDKLLHVMTDIAKEAKNEKNPQRKQILEARVGTVNNMIEQREAKLKQMTSMLEASEKTA